METSGFLYVQRCASACGMKGQDVGALMAGSDVLFPHAAVGHNLNPARRLAGQIPQGLRTLWGTIRLARGQNSPIAPPDRRLRRHNGLAVHVDFDGTILLDLQKRDGRVGFCLVNQTRVNCLEAFYIGVV